MSLTSLFWFTNNLRLDDNPALIKSCESSHLHCVYIKSPRTSHFPRLSSSALGAHRVQFIDETLADLAEQLAELNQQLHLLVGEYTEQLTKEIIDHNIDRIYTSANTGSYEQEAVREIQSRFPHIKVIEVECSTLYDQDELPFELDDLDKSFTPFRKRVESIAIKQPLSAPNQLPPPIIQTQSVTSINRKTQNRFKGGERAGIEHLKSYFASNAPTTYKETRNALDDWESSTKFSPWLAVGAVSPRRIIQMLNHFEQSVVQNESTYWIKFELLWREYFQWNAHKWGHKLFSFKGPYDRQPLTTFYPKRFKSWTSGSTPYPIVNAAMKQLAATGYMSNRARQLVASCLVHELEIDWRYGADYFEQQLIDFDLGSNWGNWQYLAGVGADPRGHRQFDLKKQTEIYDPNLEFIKSWGGDVGMLPLNQQDYYGYPTDTNYAP